MNLVELAINLAKLGFKKVAAATWATLAGNPSDNTAMAAVIATIPTNAPQIGAVSIVKGTWDASTNTPTLASGTAPTDNVFARQVTVAGSTTIDGESTWKVGDVITWNGTTWTRTVALPVGPGLLKVDASRNPALAVSGTDYATPNPLLSTTVPIVLPPSGSTIGANGAAYTGAVAFLDVWNAPGCWMRFNANEIASGSAAAWYPVVMSTTQAGVIYNNPVVDGSSFASFAWPTTLTPFTTNAGSTTAGITTAVQGPAGSNAAAYVGKSGTTEFIYQIRNPNNANSKSGLAYYGGTQAAITTATTNTSTGADIIVANKGDYAKQVVLTRAYAGGSAAPGALTVNTNVAYTVGFYLRTNVATDWVALIYSQICQGFVA